MPHTASLSLIVRSTEIDVNGHVNNAKYVEYLEWGREEWYDTAGLPHDRLLALGCITVTAKLVINYRKECRQGDRLVVTTIPERIGRTSFVVRQEIHDQHGDCVLDAEVTTVTIDPVTRKSRPVAEPLARLIPAPSE